MSDLIKSGLAYAAALDSTGLTEHNIIFRMNGYEFVVFVSKQQVEK